jgi:hypothetical protein
VKVLVPARVPVQAWAQVRAKAQVPESAQVSAQPPARAPPRRWFHRRSRSHRRMLPPAQRRRASRSLAAMPAPAAVTASRSSRRTSCFVCFQDWHFVSPRPFVSDHLRRRVRCRSDVPGFIGATASLPCKAARSVPEPVSRGNSHCRAVDTSSCEATTGASYRSSTPPAMALATKLTSLDASCALHAGLRSQGEARTGPRCLLDS